MLSSWTKKSSVCAVLFPVVLTLVWNYLDASPSLFVLDAMFGGHGGHGGLLLYNKTVWITGASSGIGAALVCEVMQAGATHGA
jgi:NADPH:quinone reductase-like Zn-dependent oxidoreductase